MQSNIIVTGSDGFVGSWLCKRLNLPSKSCYDIKSGNDCTDINVQKKIAKRNVVVICLHAISGIGACVKNEVLARLTNTESVLNIAKLSKQAGSRRFIFASTSA